MILDSRTLIVVALMLSTMLGVALFLTWRVNRSIVALRHWAVANLLMAVGFLLIALRGPQPSTLELLASNAAIAGGSLWIWLGVRSFFSQPAPVETAGVLFGVKMAALLIFIEIVPDTAARVAIATLFLAVVSVLCAIDLLRAANWTSAVPAGGLGYILLGHAGFNVARAILTLHGGHLPHLLSPSTVQTLGFAESLLIILALGVGFIIMTTERLQAELRRAATYDALTGVFNRRAFLDVAEREFARFQRRGAPFSLLLLDIDHFKRINDTFGHQAGDEMLRSFSALALGALRQGDLFGRYGGEEFCALLPDTPCEGARIVAERLRESLSELVIEHEGNLIATTVSIGVAESRPGAESFDAIVSEADMALYHAKAGGRDRVEVYEEDACLRKDALAAGGKA